MLLVANSFTLLFIELPFSIKHFYLCATAYFFQACYWRPFFYIIYIDFSVYLWSFFIVFCWLFISACNAIAVVTCVIKGNL